MIDWLTLSGGKVDEQLLEVFFRLLAGWLAGAAVAAVYRRTRDKERVTPSLPGTLVLLSVLIAMVTQVIGDNVARAFSLVGALAIVRFRTVVRDTQDTAFVIFAVAVGMAVGAGHALVGLAGLVVASAAAFAMRSREPDQSESICVVEIRTALGVLPAEVVEPLLKDHVRSFSLRGVGTSRQGLSLDLSYAVELNSAQDAEPLVRTLNRTEGVQDVRLRLATVRED
jgi:hypothetical protein